MTRLAKDEALRWLREDDAERLDELFARAEQVRSEHVGDAVHLRGLLEISNRCRRGCLYCGLRSENREVERYRMSQEQILSCARHAASLGYGTLVMQAGEDPGIGAEWLAEVVREVKRQTALAVTLSMGEREPGELELWKRAGADRYLLRFETSDSRLFAHIHPSLPGRTSDRIALLRLLRSLGYEIGSGVMVGLPGQSYESLVTDLETFEALDLDMVGIGPYLPHPATPLAAERSTLGPGLQAPSSVLMTLKLIALTRLVCPEANIPSTTALATLEPQSGRELGLRAGANVLMPNLAAPDVRVKYDVYPNKVVADASEPESAAFIHEWITKIGRTVGTGAGGRRDQR